MSTYSNPDLFFEAVIELDSQDEIIDYCIELLEYLKTVIHSRGGKYKVSTISKMLTEYKKPFYGFVHENDSLNETVEIRHYCLDGEFEHTFKKRSDKHGVEAGDTKRYTIISKKQHVAGNLLALSEKQLLELVNRRIDNLIEKEAKEKETIA